MSVHGIVEQYPGGPYPSQPRHNAESNAEDTEFRALSAKGYFKSMLTTNANVFTKPVRVHRRKIIYAKKIAVLQIGSLSRSKATRIRIVYFSSYSLPLISKESKVKHL